MIGRFPFSRLWQPVFLAFLFFAAPGTISAETSRNQAPDFELADLTGTVHRLSSYRGRIVVLNFWATWCPDCIREIPALNAFARSNQEIVVLGIASDRDPAALRRFITPLSLEYPILIDTTGDVFVRKYLVRTLPTTFLIDREGSIGARLFGAIDFTSRGFRDRIRRLEKPSL